MTDLNRIEAVENAAPILNLNGTSKESLLEGYQKAYRAIDAAINAVAATAPHGRDYQTDCTSDRYKTAHEQHINRMIALELIKADYEILATAIHSQGNNQ